MRFLEIEKQKHHSNWPTSNEGCCDDHFDALLEIVYSFVDSFRSNRSSDVAAQTQFHAPHCSNTCTLLLSFSTFLDFCSPHTHTTPHYTTSITLSQPHSHIACTHAHTLNNSLDTLVCERGFSLHMTMPKSQNAKLPGNVNELALYLLLLLLPLLELLLLLLRFSVLSVRCYFSRVS